MIETKDSKSVKSELDIREMKLGTRKEAKRKRSKSLTYEPQMVKMAAHIKTSKTTLLSLSRQPDHVCVEPIS